MAQELQDEPRELVVAAIAQQVVVTLEGTTVTLTPQVADGVARLLQLQAERVRRGMTNTTSYALD